MLSCVPVPSQLPGIHRRIHQVFPVIRAGLRAISPGTDLVRVQGGKGTFNGLVVRINDNDLPEMEIILAGKIEYGCNTMVFPLSLPNYSFAKKVKN